MQVRMLKFFYVIRKAERKITWKKRQTNYQFQRGFLSEAVLLVVINGILTELHTYYICKVSAQSEIKGKEAANMDRKATTKLSFI